MKSGNTFGPEVTYIATFYCISV